MDLGAKQSTEQLHILYITYNILRIERCAPDSDVIENLSRINILVTLVYHTEYDVIDTQMSGSAISSPQLIPLPLTWVLRVNYSNGILPSSTSQNSDHLWRCLHTASFVPGVARMTPGRED
jgi:hypothetical protein